MSRPCATAPVTDAVTETVARVGTTVLVVDDVAAERELLATELEAHGYQVIRAACGAEAITLYEKWRPPLVFMNAVLPDMEGAMAAARLRNLSASSLQEIVLLGTQEDLAVLGQCLEAGGDEFLFKPLDRTMLKARLLAFDRLQGLHREVESQYEELMRLQSGMSNEQEVARRIIRQVHAQGEAGMAGMRHLVRSADILCGDLLLACRRPSGGLNVLIADLTGHGLAAAVAALPVAQIFNAMTAKGFAAEDLVRETNRKLKDILAHGMFCAATLIYFADEGVHGYVWNGGMPDLLVYDGKVRQRIPSRHLPLGILDDNEFDDGMELFHVREDDRVFIYSDGLTEAEDRRGRFFGDERLVALLEAGNPDEGFDRVVRELRSHCSGVPVHDDISFLEIPCRKEMLAPRISARRSGSVRAAMAWSWGLELNGDALGNVDPVPLVLNELVKIQGLNPYADVLFTIVSELYNNALDHGVLNLSSAIKAEPEGFENYYMERERRLSGLRDGYVKIAVTCEPLTQGGRLTFRVEDSGKGFDHRSTIAGLSDPNAGFSGRGLALLHEICEQLRFSGNGNVVEASFVWPAGENRGAPDA